MRPKLLKNFIVVLLFWLTATTLYWSVQRPEVNLAALARVKQLVPFLPISVPENASIFGSLSVQRDVLLYWSLPVAVLAAMSALLGFGLIWSFAAKKSKDRLAREQSTGEFRGITQTIGELPMPEVLPRDDIDLGAEDNEALGRITEKEQRLLCDILGTISAHPSAYSGPGISVPLLDHTLNLAAKALAHRRNPGLSAIVVSAHELAKITAYTKSAAGEWSLVKKHDRESARILATLDSWTALPYLDRSAVMMAVKFHSTPKLIPDLDGDPQIYRFARDLLTAADGAQTEVVTEEKQKTLDKTELPDVIFDAFAQSLPQLSFQNRGLPKGVAAVAWKIGNRVYLLEIKLRETVMAKMPVDVRGALAPNPKERQRLQPFTNELLKALESRGWLVRKIGETKLETREALWNIKAGKLDFKGVIVVDVPQEFMSQLPSDDSMYEVSVTGPLFNPSSGGGGSGPAAANMGLSKQDLLGSVLKPAGAATPAGDSKLADPPV